MVIRSSSPCKVSGVQDLIGVYRELARRCDYALHLGLTEAGMGTKGTVASTAALSILLQEGIGDTIRVSLTLSQESLVTRKSWSRLKYCRRLDCVSLCRVSLHVPVVDAQPAPRSKNLPSKSMTFACANASVASSVSRG